MQILRQCVHISVHVFGDASVKALCRDQRVSFKSQFYPSAMWEGLGDLTKVIRLSLPATRLNHPLDSIFDFIWAL